ncbi:MBL fold metallo-hydrolase [Defluviitalea raffinosedens]|uniref:MBL fold metallo-hydrolase n=1 Tax=Defluviitalea raffinosedens TaxID=1450156 RepID=UPI00195C765D|nr:MBL fold metallo-hydrolase [Defluviitalea raffinosedens]MBM7684762.1 glyoxylase-like metal-dependent hydrolase (beta-lactamase superfamily II) [Defluviitalea raffinosedens]
MIFKVITVGMMGVNCYIMGDQTTGKGVVVDPGAEGSKIIEAIKKENLDIEYIFLTHGHFDHIGALDKVREFTGAEVVIHEEGREYLNDPSLNLSGAFAHRGFTKTADQFVSDGALIKVGNLTFKVIHTPGHTMDGVNYYEENHEVLFSGDNLFQNSIGRTDFPKGDFHLLVTGIKKKLLILPEDVAVYPGHGASTTIGSEKRENPYLNEDGWDV